MKTSSFSKSGRAVNAVSIARSAPADFRGPSFRPLAPSYELLQHYRLGHISIAEYTDRYVEQLSHLDARRVFDLLGEDAILLCWEGASRFCHRRLVAEWFERELGVSVPESV